MSFLGTKKYPGEEEFSSFLSAHGGASNAYTDSEDTVYVSYHHQRHHQRLYYLLTRLVVHAVQYFDVNAESLPGGLDRFSQFFVAPLFTASATSRELNAIESEHAKNINSDSFRIYQVRGSAHSVPYRTLDGSDTLSRSPSGGLTMISTSTANLLS
jgi:insulysin